MTTIGLHRPEDPDLEGMSARDAIDLGHAVAPDQGDVERVTHPTRKGDHARIKERMNIDHPKIGGGEMTLLHHHSRGRTDLPNNLNCKLTKSNRGLSHHCLNPQLLLS